MLLVQSIETLRFENLFLCGPGGQLWFWQLHLLLLQLSDLSPLAQCWTVSKIEYTHINNCTNNIESANTITSLVIPQFLKEFFCPELPKLLPPLYDSLSHSISGRGQRMDTETKNYAP
jgi:hypothetical protein